MLTYQDLLKNINNKESFILSVINDYKSSDLYKNALIAEAYSKQRNTTIMKYQKLLRTASGRLIPDRYSANNKLCSNYAKIILTQANQFLLGNGVIFKDGVPDKLGNNFSHQIQKAGYSALKGTVSYVFYNLDHVDVFTSLQFAPLVDEEDGALKAGVRFWQISPDKPLRATLYELDGYTEYIYNSKDKNKNPVFEVLKPKTPYKLRLYTTPAVNNVIYEGMNYPSFPIVPLWGNPDKQSILIGIREEIDAYDLIRSGFANDLDDCSQIYWLIENAGGMSEEDLAEFLAKIARNHIAEVGADSKVTPYTQEVPHEARDKMLDRLEHDIFKDAMALNTGELSNGNVTATAIQAAYEPLNEKTDEYEYCVRECIDEILKLAEVNNTEYAFKRSMICNQSEVTQMVISASDVLDKQTILEKLPFIEEDEIPDILKRIDDEDVGRYFEEEEPNPSVNNPQAQQFANEMLLMPAT